MLLTQDKQALGTMRSSESQHFEIQTEESEADSLYSALGLQPGENNLETIGRAAALINKLFIVTKWLGQRLNISLKPKADRAKSNTR